MGGGLVRWAKSAHHLYILLVFFGAYDCRNGQAVRDVSLSGNSSTIEGVGRVGRNRLHCLGVSNGGIRLRVSSPSLSLCATAFAARTTLEKGTHVYRTV